MREAGNEYGWDHPVTADRYEAFCRTHPRYAEANQVLVSKAGIEPGQRVLDFAAGTGRTAELVLPRIGAAGRLVAVEPARAMLEVGRARLQDDRIEWRSELPERVGVDRVLCGAALWQVPDLPALFRQFRSMLPVGGAFCFTQPSLYAGIPDRPGGGVDPQLHQLPAKLANGRVASARNAVPVLGLDELNAALRAAGFESSFTRFEVRLTQLALRDWLAIPVITDALLGDLDVGQRDQRLEAAYLEVDPDGYRWEGWLCFRAAAV